MEIKSASCYPCPIPANASISVVIGEEPIQEDKVARKNIGFKFVEEYDGESRTKKPMKLKIIAGHDRWQDMGELEPEKPIQDTPVDDFVKLLNGKIKYNNTKSDKGSLVITGILKDLITPEQPAYEMEIKLNWRFTKK